MIDPGEKKATGEPGGFFAGRRLVRHRPARSQWV